MSDKGFGSKIFGLFVESDPSGAPREGDGGASGKTPAQELADLAASTHPHPSAGGAAPLPKLEPAPLASSGKVDFDAIFREAGMDAGELDRAAKAEQLLKSLPPDSPHAVKKQIVEASLHAFGFETQKIVAAAQNQQRAIEAYVRVNENSAAHALKETETQVQQLNEKIAALRADSQRRSSNLMTLSAAAQERRAELQKILDFFQSPAAPAGSPADKS